MGIMILAPPWRRIMREKKIDRKVMGRALKGNETVSHPPRD